MVNCVYFTGVLALVLFILLAVAFFMGKYIGRDEGGYTTHEAKDAEYYENADFAIASGNSQQPGMEKTKEWFI